MSWIIWVVGYILIAALLFALLLIVLRKVGEWDGDIDDTFAIAQACLFWGIALPIALIIALFVVVLVIIRRCTDEDV